MHPGFASTRHFASPLRFSPFLTQVYSPPPALGAPLLTQDELLNPEGAIPSPTAFGASVGHLVCLCPTTANQCTSTRPTRTMHASPICIHPPSTPFLTFFALFPCRPLPMVPRRLDQSIILMGHVCLPSLCVFSRQSCLRQSRMLYFFYFSTAPQVHVLPHTQVPTANVCYNFCRINDQFCSSLLHHACLRCTPGAPSKVQCQPVVTVYYFLAIP